MMSEIILIHYNEEMRPGCALLQLLFLNDMDVYYHYNFLCEVKRLRGCELVLYECVELLEIFIFCFLLMHFVDKPFLIHLNHAISEKISLKRQVVVFLIICEKIEKNAP